MRKLIVEFLREFEYHNLKIVQVNSILIAKSIILLFFAVFGSVEMDGDFLCIVHL